MAYTFRGGMRFKSDMYDGAELTVEHPPLPNMLLMPLPETGSLSVPLGSHVDIGGVVFLDENGTPAVHAPMSGRLTELMDLSGRRYVRLVGDGNSTYSAGLQKMNKKLSEAVSEEIIEKIRNCGICDTRTGEQVFARLRRAVGNVDSCIVSCVECEPYVSCERAAALTRTAAVLNGQKIILRALGVRHGTVAVAADDIVLKNRISEMTDGRKMFSLLSVVNKYPMEDYKRLAYALSGRMADDPIDIGCFVVSAQTCIAVYDAFVEGIPQLKRVVTVGGDCVERERNFEVPLGTSFRMLAEYAGGIKKTPKLILEGGLLRGGKTTLEGAVGQTTGTVILLSEDEIGCSDVDSVSPVCIRCGKCVEVCPEGLLPNYIYNYLRDNKKNLAVLRGARRCTECGLCSYVCPGRAPVAELISEFNACKKAGL